VLLGNNAFLGAVSSFMYVSSYQKKWCYKEHLCTWVETDFFISFDSVWRPDQV